MNVLALVQLHHFLDLSDVVHRLHETFITLAAQLYEIHEAVKVKPGFVTRQPATKQNCSENCILGEHFWKNRSCTDSSLSPSPWKQCCVLNRKPDPWAFVGSNIEVREGDSFLKAIVLEIVR